MKAARVISICLPGCMLVLFGIGITIANADEPPKPETITNKFGMTFVKVPAGTFMMGTEGEGPSSPAHEVEITKGFYFGEVEVTWRQYLAIRNAWEARHSEKGDEDPLEDNPPPETDQAEDVSTWQEGVEFSRMLSAVDPDYDYRLPTEAEWEYACRGPDGEQGVSRKNPGRLPGQTIALTQKVHPPNGFGLYDMQENVGELCWDYIDSDYYAVSPRQDPVGPKQGGGFVVRGFPVAGFAYSATYRYGIHEIGTSDMLIGFRLVLVKQEKTSEGTEAAAEDLPKFDTVTNNFGMKFVKIPAGKFVMGVDGEGPSSPAHEVEITNAFYLGETELTERQVLAIQNKWEAKHGIEAVDDDQQRLRAPRLKQASDLPHSMLRSVEADELVRRLNDLDSQYDYRLPTEAEWEYACRGPQPEDEAIEEEEIFGPEVAIIRPPKSHPPNGFGLYDMTGNLAEFCSDYFDYYYYKHSPVKNPAGPPYSRQHGYHVVRGVAALSRSPRLCTTERAPSSTASKFGHLHAGVRLVLVKKERPEAEDVSRAM